MLKLQGTSKDDTSDDTQTNGCRLSISGNTSITSGGTFVILRAPSATSLFGGRASLKWTTISLLLFPTEISDGG